ncbi:MAG TPA: TonB-dependent receptor [Novosphingobium sp.]
MSKSSVANPAFLALSCVGAIAFATAAHAQDQKLGGVTVTDTAIDEAPVKAERAESPKYTAPLLDTPQTITVITSKSIQQQNLLSLRDVLQTVPGITFGAGEGGFGYGDRIILRGQDAKNDVTIDGVRSSAFLNRNETYNFEQVEVTNGANSVYNGGGSVAGTINLVTKKPLAQDQFVVNAGIGTDNYYRGTVDLNKRVSDLIAIRLNAVAHKNDVPGRDVENYERWGVAPAITIGVDSPTNLTLQYEHLDDNAMPQYGIRYFPQATGSKRAGGFLPDFDLGGYYGFANLDRQDSVTNSVQAIFSHEFSDTVRIRSLTRYEQINQHTITSQPQGTFCLASTGLQPPAGDGTTAACPTNVPAGYYLPTGGRGVQRLITNDTAYTQLDLSAEFATGGIEHSLVIGASALWENYKQAQATLPRNADGSTPNFPLVRISDPESFVPGPAGFAYGNNTYNGPINAIRASDNRGERTSYAVYLFDTMKFGEMFEINGGLRYEHAKGENRTTTYVTTAGASNLGAISAQTGPFRNDDNLFSYRIGLVFKPTPDVSLYVATGTSKNPSQSSVDGACVDATCNLRPETTKNYEIGVKADLFGKALRLEAALFRNDRDSIRVVSGDPTVTSQQLDGRQRVQGVSLGASGNITENWTVSANYMYMDAKVLQGGSDRCFANPAATGCATTIVLPGARLANAPEHSGSLFTTYRFPFGLELGYGITYQGSFPLNQPTIADPRAIIYDVPSYTIHRLMVSYPITPNLMAQVNVQNFTNERYVTTVRTNINSSWAQPAPTRSAVFSLNYTF